MRWQWKTSEKASITASALTGNANTKLTPQEEETGDSQQQEPHPLVQDDSEFREVLPNLFWPDFSKQAKEHLD